MNRPEEEGGRRHQSRLRSAVSRSLRRMHKLFLKDRGKNKRETTTTTPPLPSTAAPGSTSSTTTTSRPALGPTSSTTTTSRPALSSTRPFSPARPFPNPPPVASAVEHYPLMCNLEELYTGSLRTLPYTRTVLHSDGTTTTTHSHTFKVRVLPGWSHGTTVTFHRAGSVLHPGHPPGDVVYTVEELPHETFTREGDDLVMGKKISLVEALTGCGFVVRTLDGRRLKVDVGSVVPAGFEIGILGEGMPVVGGGRAGEEEARKGRLRVKFEVEYPEVLSAGQKEGIKRLLMQEEENAETSAGEI